MRTSLNSQTINAIQVLERHEEKKVWRAGVAVPKPVVNPEAAVYFDSKESAIVWREDGLKRGDKVVLPDVAEATVQEASDFARSCGAPRVRVYDIDLEIVEWWFV
jgi:hypothetical protein